MKDCGTMYGGRTNRNKTHLDLYGFFFKRKSLSLKKKADTITFEKQKKLVSRDR